MMQGNNNEIANDFNRQAYEFIEAGSLDKVKLMAESAIKVDPRNVLSFNLLAGIYYELGDYKTAFETMVFISPEFKRLEHKEAIPALRNNLALAYIESNNLLDFLL